MPYTVEVGRSGQFVCTRHTGTLTMDEIMEVAAILNVGTKYVHPRHALINLTEVNRGPSNSEFVLRLREPPRVIPRIERIALVIRTDQVEMAEFQVLASRNSGYDIEHFFSEVTALMWLIGDEQLEPMSA